MKGGEEETSTALSSDGEDREELVKKLRKELAHLTGKGGPTKGVSGNKDTAKKRKDKHKDKGEYRISFVAYLIVKI